MTSPADALRYRDERDALRSEVTRLRAELAAERARRTLGGVPAACTPGWARGTLPAPPSASDPAAPALVRGPERAR